MNTTAKHVDELRAVRSQRDGYQAKAAEFRAERDRLLEENKALREALERITGGLHTYNLDGLVHHSFNCAPCVASSALNNKAKDHTMNNSKVDSRISRRLLISARRPSNPDKDVCAEAAAIVEDLTEALEKIKASITLVGDPELARDCYCLEIARAALAKAK